MNFLALLVAVGVFCSVCSGSSVSLLGFRTYRETFSSEGFRPSSRINRFRSSPLTSPEPINVVKKKNTNCVLWTNSNFQYRAVASWGGGGAVFGRTVNPISTRGADYAHHSTTSPPPPPDFQPLRRPSYVLQSTGRYRAGPLVFKKRRHVLQIGGPRGISHHIAVHNVLDFGKNGVHARVKCFISD